MQSEVHPYGTWPSHFPARRIAEGALRLSQPRLDRGLLYWLEGRPAEGGRQVVMRWGEDGVREVTPAGVSVRTRVHEYGGGDYCARDGVVYFVDFEGQRVHRRVPGGEVDVLTPEGARYADLEPSPDGRWLAAVEERHGGGAPENRLVAIPLLGGGTPRVVAEGFDFVSSPRFSPDGRQLVFTAWNHPDMPWDAAALYSVAWNERPGAPRRLVGGDGESIFQPGFSPGGRVTFVSDRSGWWNLEQLRDGGRVALCPREAEFGRPQWSFGLSTWGFVAEEVLLCVYGLGGRYRLARLDLSSGALDDLPLPFEAYDGLHVDGAEAALIGAGPDRAPVVGTFDLTSGVFHARRHAFALEVDASFVSLPEALRFPTGAAESGESGHAFFYAPANPEARGPAGERPPLLVLSHGGPTGAAMPALQLGIQYWTSRGFAVVDVNYRGSTGFGRAYRERLNGEWGIVDVEDCIRAARFLAARGDVDPARLIIRGGSAGGYTTLCALTFHDVFQAGASHFGIGDLEALARDTHKFESRYLDRLVGPYPERRDLYVARSPIHFAERLSCPVIFFQGLEDRVVPASQAEAMVAALAARGIPHAYVAFEGEQHGFRKSESIQTALERELAFYAESFGF